MYLSHTEINASHRMRRIEIKPDAIAKHVNAVKARIAKTFNESDILKDLQLLEVDSIESFITADINEMRKWVRLSPEKLQFTYFREIYSNYFCKGSSVFVDGNYNAYTFLNDLGITVCPYCDDEYLDIIDRDGTSVRTSEIDHFFPKSKYPALAMCYYNLIPSGQNCNGLKKELEIEANPYEIEIESLTWLHPDIPIGVNIESITPNECIVHFHPQGGMRRNVIVFGLEQRYERHASEAHRLLLNRQNFTEEKIAELVKMGFGTRDEIISSIFGPQNPDEKKKTLRQKMLFDITGY